MNKDRHFDVIIIGAGVVGCMVACGLSRYRVSIAVVEKESDVGKGSSTANSAIIHSAHDPRCVLTTSVRIKNGIWSLVPVRTPVLVSKKITDAAAQGFTGYCDGSPGLCGRRGSGQLERFGNPAGGQCRSFTRRYGRNMIEYRRRRSRFLYSNT